MRVRCIAGFVAKPALSWAVDAAVMHGSINTARPARATPLLSPASILGMMLAILLSALPSLATAQGSRHIDASI
ncbi:MAG: hypothetical protein B7Z07_02800, partial [Sphingomonadales bacterium 32-67-7]